MVEAFVLVQLNMGGGRVVTEEIAAVSGVQMAQLVTGPYDVIARVQAEDMGVLNQTIDQIQGVRGVSRTMTCTVIKL